MSWLNKYHRGLRFAVIGLLLVAILGPWGFDRINVPAEYPCNPPVIRLEGDFCGVPLSGGWIFIATLTELFNKINGLLTGTRANPDMQIWLYLTVFPLSIVLPMMSTALISGHEPDRRRRVFHIASWCLALTTGLLIFFSMNAKVYWVLWGNLLYVMLAAGALLLEILTLAAGKIASRDLPG